MSIPLIIVVKCWPRLSETFVAQELAALEARGQRYEIWSLRHPTSEKLHPLHRQVQAGIRYLPEYLHQEILRTLRSWWIARQLPGYANAYNILWNDFKRDLSRNRLRRFGQACVLAVETPDTACGIYAHFLHTPSSVARYAAIIKAMPWSYSAHAKDIWTTPEWELREKLDPASYGAEFGVTCTASGARFLRSLSVEPERLDLVYHGLDLSRFPQPPARAEAPSIIQLLSVGRLVEKKGFDNLVEALALLPTSLDWNWTHIGGGALQSQLQGAVSDLHIDARVNWLGECEQPTVIEAMRQADLFILPSRVAFDGDRDGLPNVLMEAASQKLPILSTAVSAIPEFIQHGKHGHLCTDLPAELAKAIVLLAQDRVMRLSYAEAAYDRLVEEFGMDTGITLLDQRLRALCEAN